MNSLTISTSDVSAMFVGARLTLGRQLAGLRKTDIATAIEKTPTAVAAYESGRTRPSPATVARLSIALGVSPTFFLAPSGSAVSAGNLSPPHFRSLRSTTQIARDQATAYGSVVNDIVTVFERHVELPGVGLPIETLDPESASFEAPLNAAGKMRSCWRLGKEPVDHLLRAAENHGVVCVFSPIPAASVDAYSFETRSRPMIILNPLKGDYYRQRFDLAHELGHLVMHRDADPGSHGAEQQANRFASELLMPETEVAPQLPRRLTWPRLLELKEHWGVSLAALLFRSRELSILSETTYRNAMARMSREGWRRQEPGARRTMEQPSLLPRALKLLDDAGISAQAIASEARAPYGVFAVATARNIESVREKAADVSDYEPSEDPTDSTKVSSLLK